MVNLSTGLARIQANDSRFLPIDKDIQLTQLTLVNLTAYLVIRLRTFGQNNTEVALVDVTLSKTSYAQTVNTRLLGAVFYIPKALAVPTDTYNVSIQDRLGRYEPLVQ
jgi:hypothetical protein